MKTKHKQSINELASIIAAYVIMFIIFSIIAPYFMTWKNLMNILLYSSVIGISATGITMILLTGCMDISVGAIIGISGMISGIALSNGAPVGVGILLSLGMGIVCGAFNGLLVAKLKVTPLIATLASQSIIRGAALLTTGGLSLMISNESFKILGRHYIMGVMPVCVIIMFAFFLIAGYVLKYTPFGRNIYSTGGNIEASRLAGISVDRIRIIAYMISGLCAGLSGVIMASQTGAAIPTAGTGTEMDIVGAVVLGGTRLSGGKGNIVGTFIGVLVFVTLSNALTLLNVMSFWQTVAKGIVLLLAVVMDVARGGIKV